MEGQNVLSPLSRADSGSTASRDNKIKLSWQPGWGESSDVWKVLRGETRVSQEKTHKLPLFPPKAQLT